MKTYVWFTIAVGCLIYALTAYIYNVRCTEEVISSDAIKVIGAVGFTILGILLLVTND